MFDGPVVEVEGAWLKEKAERSCIKTTSFVIDDSESFNSTIFNKLYPQTSA